MKLKNGVQTIETIDGKRVIKSGAVGATNVDEVKWLTQKLVSLSAGWRTAGWAYIVDISDMAPCSPDVSEELVNLHKELTAAGCKAMAFVEFGAVFTAAQAKQHQKKSNAAIQEGHFKNEAEAIAWIDTIL